MNAAAQPAPRLEPGAVYCYDTFVRKELMTMLMWYVGAYTGFSYNLGLYHKYLLRELEPELRSLLMSTYADADEAHN